jgi:hypothetical protein
MATADTVAMVIVAATPTVAAGTVTADAACMQVAVVDMPAAA